MLFGVSFTHVDHKKAPRCYFFRIRAVAIISKKDNENNVKNNSHNGNTRYDDTNASHDKNNVHHNDGQAVHTHVGEQSYPEQPRRFGLISNVGSQI